MDRSAFQVRDDTCVWVTAEISALKLHKNEDGGYVYDDALILEEQIKRVFEWQYYESSSNGMKGLLVDIPNSVKRHRVDQSCHAFISAEGLKDGHSSRIHLDKHGGARYQYQHRRTRGSR